MGMERIGAQRRVGAAAAHDPAHPIGRVRRHVGDLTAAVFTERVEEPAQRLGVATGSGLHQPSGVVSTTTIK